MHEEIREREREREKEREREGKREKRTAELLRGTYLVNEA